MSEYIGEYVVSLTAKTFTDLRFHRHEEIVRCRDCKYYKPWVLSRPENGGDCVLNKVEVDVWFDGFCAWGERETINKTGDIVTHDSRAERTCKMRADGAHCMNGVEFYECRSCGEYACIPTVMGKSEPPNYCPNCGCKVVEQ